MVLVLDFVPSDDSAPCVDTEGQRGAEFPTGPDLGPDLH